MVKIKPEEYFYTCNGEVLKTKKELLEFLKKADDTTFSYHVNEYKNDFANWIRDIFKDLVLSSKMRSIMNSQEMASIVEEKIKPRSQKDKSNIINKIKEAING